MPIVKRRKKSWLNKDLSSYETTVTIRLNKEDVFEFDLPDHYVEVFEQTSEPDIRGGDRVRGGKVLFDTMTAFDGCHEAVTAHFKDQIITLTEEKVLVVTLEGKTTDRAGWDENVFRMNWGGSHNLYTFINFKFERGLRVGKIMYQVHDNAPFSERDKKAGSGWDRLSNTFHVSSTQRESDDVMIVIPYTEEREKFLKAFKQELADMIHRVDDFMKVFDKPETLSLIDNGGLNNLLTAPSLQIEDAEIIEEDLS